MMGVRKWRFGRPRKAQSVSVHLTEAIGNCSVCTMSMGIDDFVFNGFGERKLGNIKKVNKLQMRFIVTLDSPALFRWQLGIVLEGHRCTTSSAPCLNS